ncbi:MAG TPA: chromate resistance protein ChrB domain-containing protein [Geobacteraceae bacterium]
MKKDTAEKQEWLLFFYSVPSKPVSNRMRVWRMLLKAGAVQFKGAAYILPASEDHRELFQWLVSSVTAMQGEAAFVRVPGIETMTEDDIVGLFDRQREKDYLDLGNRLDEFQNRIGKIGKRVAPMDNKKMEEELQKFVKEFNEIGKIDFFISKGRKDLEKRLKTMASEITGRPRAESAKHAVEVIKRRATDYQGKRWVTRKRPFIDRVASAWLIKGFIDRKAAFGFIDESEIEGLGKDTIAFDMVGGEFTHIGDMSTFEVLLKSFGLKGKALGVVAEIVHQLDLQDEKYRNPAAEGLREILDGIRKTAKDDHEALEKGMSIFDMLYAANR